MRVHAVSVKLVTLLFALVIKFYFITLWNFKMINFCTAIAQCTCLWHICLVFLFGGVKNYLEFGKKKGSCHFHCLYAVRVEAASSCIKLELFLCRCCVQHCCSYVQRFLLFFSSFFSDVLNFVVVVWTVGVFCPCYLLKTL